MTLNSSLSCRPPRTIRRTAAQASIHSRMKHPHLVDGQVCVQAPVCPLYVRQVVRHHFPSRVLCLYPALRFSWPHGRHKFSLQSPQVHSTLSACPAHDPHKFRPRSAGRARPERTELRLRCHATLSSTPSKSSGSAHDAEAALHTSTYVPLVSGGRGRKHTRGSLFKAQPHM